MPPIADLEALLARVKALKGDDREVDGHLMAAFDPPGDEEDPSSVFVNYDGDGEGRFKTHYATPAARLRHVPAYTASIDAALALKKRALPDWLIQMWLFDGHRHPGVIMDYSYRTSIRVSVDGPTLPLTILAALLSAKIEEARHGV